MSIKRLSTQNVIEEQKKKRNQTLFTLAHEKKNSPEKLNISRKPPSESLHFLEKINNFTYRRTVKGEKRTIFSGKELILTERSNETLIIDTSSSSVAS